METGRGSGAICAALLLLLGVSGYAGAQKHEATAAVSVPITFEAMKAGDETGMEEDMNRLGRERERVLSLLEDVIRDPKASQQTVQSAMTQKMQLASDMEKEAKLVEALEQIGIQPVAVIVGDQVLSVFVPQGAADDKNRVQIVDMASAVTGISAECVKIILVKND